MRTVRREVGRRTACLLTCPVEVQKVAPGFEAKWSVNQLSQVGLRV